MRRAEPQPDSEASTPATDTLSASALRNRILANFSRLVGGRAIAALLSLSATAMMARALGPTEFGLVILVHAYVVTIKGLFNFKPFEAIIRYGVGALERGDTLTLRRLFRLGIFVDLASSGAAALAAFSIAPLVGEHLNWNPEMVQQVMLYSLVLLSTVTGTAKGVLRLFNRFDILGRQLTVGPLFRFLGIALAWSLHLPMPAFLACWGLAMLVEQLYLAIRGWLEFKRQLGGPLLRRGPSVRDWQTLFPGIGSFLGIVYWQSNIDLVPKQLSTLLAGSLLGPAAAGLFRLAREIAGVLATPAVLLRQVLFPDLARVWYRGEQGFGKLVLRVMLVAGFSGLVIVLLSIPLGAPVLRIVYGEPYTGAATVLSLLLFAGTLDLSISALRAAGYAIGEAGRILKLSFASIIIYLLIFAFVAPSMGLPGPGVAACVASMVTLVGMLLLVRAATKKQIPEPERLR